MSNLKIPKQYRLLLTIIAVVVTFFVSSYSQQNSPSDNAKAETPAEKHDVLSSHVTATSSAFVNRVIDGDTIEVLINNAKAKVRLIGIDTPESVDPRKPVECFGKEASIRLKALIEKKEVRLEGDSSQLDRDRYDRLLRYVYLDTTLINKQMIEEGYASEYTYDLPYIYQTDFREAQNRAAANQRGLWDPNLCVQNENSSLQ